MAIKLMSKSELLAKRSMLEMIIASYQQDIISLERKIESCQEDITLIDYALENEWYK